MDIKDVNDFNLRTKELGCNYWSTYTKSGVTPYKRLGKISDILHLNNKNNQFERRVRPSKDIH